jgi:hypothetical protein
VVVGRPKPVDPPPEDSFSADDIASFNANSVGEALDFVKQGLPGDPSKIPVILNGKRVGSLADINSLPAGAIERVEVLPPRPGPAGALARRNPSSTLC